MKIIGILRLTCALWVGVSSGYAMAWSDPNDAVFDLHFGMLTPENQFQNDYINRPIGMQIARAFSFVVSGHHFFQKPERIYFEDGAFNLIRCGDEQCSNVVVQKSDGSEIQVDSFRLERKYVGTPISASSALAMEDKLDAVPPWPMDSTAPPKKGGQGLIKVDDDLVVFLKNHPDIHEIHFLPKDVINAQLDHEASIVAAAAKQAAEERDGMIRHAEVISKEVAAAEQGEMDEILARLAAQPKHRVINCNAVHMVGPDAELDAANYECPGFTNWDGVTLHQLKQAGYEVAQVDKTPFSQEHSVDAISDDAVYTHVFQTTSYKIALQMVKVR
jgi:hypothetical protein